MRVTAGKEAVQTSLERISQHTFHTVKLGWARKKKERGEMQAFSFPYHTLFLSKALNAKHIVHCIEQ